MRVTRLLLVVGIVVCAPQFAAAQDAAANNAMRAAVNRAAGTITEAELRQAIGIISDDSMMGRDTPSMGLTMTSEYLARRFEAAGLSGRPGGGFQQEYPITVITPGPIAEQVLVLEGAEGPIEFASWDQFVALPTTGARSGSGELLAITNLDEMQGARGRIAIIRTEMGTMPDVVGGIGAAIDRHKPAGVIIAMDLPPQFFAMARQFFGAGSVSLGSQATAGPPVVVVPLGNLPASLGETLRSGANNVDGWSANVATSGTAETAEAMNTVAFIEGVDPALKNEYVLFVAHMDGQGIGPAPAGDSIYNSADDNASGTAMLVELAEAFAALPNGPRRSVGFIAVSGEEKNLLGSRWYVDNPLVPLENTVALINMDMIGRNWTDSVVGIGMEHSTLGETLLQTVEYHPELNMGVMRDRWPELNLYARSDSYNFAKAGVPVLYFMSRGHQDYHQPSDVAERLDYDKIARMGQLIFHFAFGVTVMDERPEWYPEAYSEIVGN